MRPDLLRGPGAIDGQILNPAKAEVLL